jgi:peptidyl-prolyl cis-trans isomerase D
LRNARELVSWAFNAVEGEVSNPILVDDTYVVAFLDQVSKNGVPPFNHVEDRMRTGAIRKAKADLYAAQMSSGTLQEVAAAIGTNVLTATDMALKFPTIKGAGALPEPEVVGTAFAIPVGNMSQPIVGANGIWVVAPASIREAAEKTDFLSEQSSGLARARGAATLRISNAMLEAAELEDNRGVN